MKKLIKSIFSQRRKEGAPQTRLGMFAERCQQRCADWLNNKIARLSVTTIVVSMSIFLMGGGTFFVFVMFRSLMYLDEGIPAIETGGRSEATVAGAKLNMVVLHVFSTHQCSVRRK